MSAPGSRFVVARDADEVALAAWLTSHPRANLALLAPSEGASRASAVELACRLFSFVRPRKIPICNEELPTCNDKCIHCGVSHIMATARAMPLSEVQAHIAAIARSGHPRIMFAVSELTVRSDFLEILRACRYHRFSTVALVTNGRIFAVDGNAAAAVRAGATHFLVSVYGHTARIHEGMTRTPGSFAQTWRGIDALLATAARVMTNTVITRRNAEHLPALVDALVGLGVRRICLSFVQIIGAARDHADRLVPKMRDVIEPVREAIRRGRAHGVAMGVGGMPYCMLPEMPGAFGVDDLSFVFAGRSSDQITERSPYTYADACGHCGARAYCLGVQAEYLVRFGAEELRPLAGPIHIRRPTSELGADVFPDLF